MIKKLFYLFCFCILAMNVVGVIVGSGGASTENIAKETSTTPELRSSSVQKESSKSPTPVTNLRNSRAILMDHCEGKRKSFTLTTRKEINMKEEPCSCLVSQIKKKVTAEEQYNFVRVTMGLLHAEVRAGRKSDGAIDGLYKIMMNNGALSLAEFKVKMADIRSSCGLMDLGKIE